MSGHAWTDIAFADLLRFRSPVPLQAVDGHGIDSRAASWDGPGIRVLADSSLFANPLTGHREGAGTRILAETIDGFPARIVSVRRPDGGREVAVHFASPPADAAGRPGRLTVTVTADATLDEDTLLAMVRSIRFTRRDAAPSDSS